MTANRSLTTMSGVLIAFLMSFFTLPLAAYSTLAGKIYGADGREMQIRGISHFGFNAEILQPQYLWQMGWKEQIAQIKSLGFNAVRVPFVPETLYNTTPVDQLSYVEPNLNADLYGKTPLQVLDLWMAEADRQGLYILLDFHSVTKRRLYPTWFIDQPSDFNLSYNGQAYTEAHWLRDLKFVAQRYAHLPRFFGIDLYNEPNGVVRWSTGDPNAANPKNFWKPAAEKAAAAVLASNPKLLIFVEGINGNYDGIEDSSIPMNWGESFQQQAYQPLNIPNNKLVLSPHTYGPDVFVKSTFGASNYPANLAADWETLFGRYATQHPIVIGEWGGRYGQGGVGEADIKWQNALVDYLLSKNIRSSFYWCYTPNSGDTGGILDDNLQVRQDKLALLQRHWGAAPSATAPIQPPTTAPSTGDAGRFGNSGGALDLVVLLLLSGALLWRANRKTFARTARAVRFPAGGLALLMAMLLGHPTAASAAGYTAQAGKIYDLNGQEMQVRGISHFGFNADILMPQYLWEMGWKEQIAQIKSLGFNAVRVPFVPDTLYVTTPVNQLGYVEPNKNADLIGKTPLQVLDLWMAEANRQGLYVMLDFHSLSKVNQYQTWYVEDPNAYGAGKYAATWNHQPYTTANWQRDLAFVAARYAHLPNFFAIDIFNEPQAVVRWSSGDANAPNPKNFWKPAAEGAAAAILAANPKLLIFVQGINANNDGIEKPNIPINWGENFQPQAYQPLNIPNDKLVLSPHTYGPDVFVKPTFSAANYPANLAADWETLFGQFSTQHPIIIGEWGGRYGVGGVGQKDVQWQNALVDYLLSKNIRSSFYWCYTPNSGDSGGILDDNLNVRQDKMDLLKRHWGAAPAPTPTPAPTPQPQPGSYSAQFTLSPNVNEWWVEVQVQSAKALSAVHVQVNGGAWVSLPPTTWLTWASSFNVPAGSAVVFRAMASDGSIAQSGSYTWLQSAPTPTPEPSAAGALALSASSYTVAQSTGSLTVSVARSGGSGGAISVQYATADGSARAGSDYTAKSGTLNWAAGDAATKTFTVAISSASPFTGSRSFAIQLSNVAGGATLGTPTSATATIQGAAVSTAATLTLNAASYTVAQNSGSVTVTVKRSGSSSAALSVRYATANGSAQSGTDYSARSGTLKWARGVSADRSVSIPISKLTPFTGSRSFTISLSSVAGGATLGTPSTATVTINGSKAATTPAAPAYAQPYIDNFSPASGAVGTVVTLNGRGFTGVNTAWVGSAKNAAVQVISDTQMRVTVPAGATTGAIGIFNPGYASFTASSFTVTAGTPVYTQPYIQSFSPASGAVGTVVTLIGTGFTGVNVAWVGAAHDAGVSVVSDTQLRVTIPAGATTGAIGIFNPSYTSFTATSFTMTN